MALCLHAAGAMSFEGDLLVLDSYSFDDALQVHPTMLVNFHAPWCGHCKLLQPELEEAAKALSGQTVIAKVDATFHTQLAERYAIDGYPTILFFRPQLEAIEYNGVRKSESIVTWVLQELGAAVKEVTSEDDLQTAIDEGLPTASFVALGGKALRKQWKELAGKHRLLGNFIFRAHSGGDEIQVHRSLPEDVVTLMKPDLGSPEGVEKVLQFLKAERLPLFGEIGEENWLAYSNSGAEGLLWALFHPKHIMDNVTSHASAFLQVAGLFPQIKVVYVDTKIYQEHVREDLGVSEFPSLVFQQGNLSQESGALPRFTLRPSDGVMDAESIASWLGAIFDHEVSPDEDEVDPKAEDQAEDIESLLERVIGPPLQTPPELAEATLDGSSLAGPGDEALADRKEL